MLNYIISYKKNILIYLTQNAKISKNKIIIKIFKKIVMNELLDEVYIHYDVPEHTKFSPDR